jgi:hypothetical protein
MVSETMEITMRKSPNNQVALDAFLTRKAEIDRMLERLTALSGDHFNVSPCEINWGHAGTLAHDAEVLKRVTGAAIKEDEHAL